MTRQEVKDAANRLGWTLNDYGAYCELRKPGGGLVANADGLATNGRTEPELAKHISQSGDLSGSGSELDLRASASLGFSGL